jgi:hypothetical protein
MVKYYKITCYTPFVGEENDYYIATEFEDELLKFAADCVYENGNDWYDEQTLEENDMTEEEYYAECGYRCVEIDDVTFHAEAFGA